MQEKNSELLSLKLDKDVVKKLNDLNINKVVNLCNLSRKKLKEKGLSFDEINHVIIRLQLNGLDLSRK